MLKSVQNYERSNQDTNSSVRIASVATKVPEYKFSQKDALERACYFIPRFARLSNIFNKTGIETRYSCVPLEWYKTSRGWKESNQTYLENALRLLESVAQEAIEAAGLKQDEIDAVVTISSTGLAIPSLDALLFNRMNFPNHIERTPIFGLGCAGGTSGLSRATRMAQSIPDGNVLLLVVELAGINVHINQMNPSLFVSSALFGDGAAGVVLCNRAELESKQQSDIPKIVATGEHIWRDSGYIMGWIVEENGLDVVLSDTLPKFTREKLRPALEQFLAKHDLLKDDIDGFILHPGGPKVLETIEEVMSIDRDALRHSWEVLRDYGNMSAPTVLFVLDRTIKSGARGRYIMISFGPGFTVSFAVMDL